MEIIVCLKQVPNTNQVKIDPEKGTLIRQGVPTIINPEDKHALEAALGLKEKTGGKVTVLSMGPLETTKALKEALAMGADAAILVSDRAFAGSDTLATSYTLAKAIEKIAVYDLILCGRQAIDGDTAQVGPEIAEQLGIAQITYVRDIQLQGRRLAVEKVLEDGYAVVETSLPALLTVVSELNTPRYPSIRGIVHAFEKDEVQIWDAQDLSVDKSRLGLAGSPTQVVNTHTPSNKRSTKILQGQLSEVVSTLVGQLKERNLI